MTKTYKDLEKSILACLLYEPKLMNQLKLKDEHFISTQRMWRFMKIFYDKYKTFDVALMYSICVNKYQIINNIEALIDYPALTTNFNAYQNILLKLYEEKENEDIYINKIYDYSNELFIRKINLDEFKEKIDEIFENRKEGSN